MSRASFDRLGHRIEREYEAKGYGKKRAEHIGQATAGKVAHRKWAKSGKVPAAVQRQRSCVREGMEGRKFANRHEQQAHFGRVVKDCAAQEAERMRRGAPRRRRGR